MGFLGRFIANVFSSEDQAEAEAQLHKAAKGIKDRGVADEMGARLEKKRGVWQVNIYRRED